jgi:hypothetical protein
MRLPGGPRRRPTDTLGRKRVRRVIAKSEKRVRGDRAKSRSRRSSEYPRRENPKGASSGRCANPTSVAKDSRKGQSPETAAYLGRPIAPAAGAPIGETVRGSVRSVMRLDTFREGNAPKGESHERCRCETKPVRDRREENVKRVTKP